MKIGIASDHRGVFLKARLVEYLEHQGHKVVDYGTNEVESTDFPKYAFKLGKAIKRRRHAFPDAGNRNAPSLCAFRYGGSGLPGGWECAFPAGRAIYQRSGRIKGTGIFSVRGAGL